jgi:outer membrane protein TolC
MSASRRVRVLSAVVAAALLSGCALGPDYKRPTSVQPAAFRGQVTAEAGSLADAPWWEAFQDPMLRGLIQEALGSNYDAGIAAARVQELVSDVAEAYFDLLALDVRLAIARNSVDAYQGTYDLFVDRFRSARTSDALLDIQVLSTPPSIPSDCGPSTICSVTATRLEAVMARVR